MDYPLKKMSLFFEFLKICFSALKFILFYPEYQKTIFSDLISPKNPRKKNFDFWPKKMEYPLTKMTIFSDLLKLQFSGLKCIPFYPEYQETIFINIITSKTLLRKQFEVWPKPWTNLLGKGRFFGAPQNVTFLL